MQRRRRARAAAGATGLLLALAAPVSAGRAGPAGRIHLPAPAAARAQELALVCNPLVGGTAERCKPSTVPGPVADDEVVLVGLDGSGTPASVQVEQRLLLSGAGDYVVRERGPARSAVGLVPDSDPPSTKLGAVVFEGFSPGRRQLGARLSLDAGLEAPRLPLAVALSLDTGQGPRPLGPDGGFRRGGRLRVRLINRTEQPADLPSAADAAAPDLARPLDLALRAARGPAGPRLPSTATDLPAALDVLGPALRAGRSSVPLRITGRLTLVGTRGRVAGPGTTARPDGADIAGTLSAAVGTVTFALDAARAGRLVLDLTVVPVLDPRALTPPRGLASWAAWARSAPPRAERQAALDLLVSVAATGARAGSYSPYLGADLPGTGSTVFRYGLVPAGPAAARPRVLHARPGRIALAAVAALLLLANAGLLWRAS